MLRKGLEGYRLNLSRVTNRTHLHILTSYRIYLAQLIFIIIRVTRANTKDPADARPKEEFEFSSPKLE